MKYGKYLELVKKISKYKIPSNQDIENLRFKEELGIDSIKMIELIVEFENILGKEIKFEEINLIIVETPGQLWKAIVDAGYIN